MSTTDTRDWRPLIFLAVLIFHIAIVFLAIRAARQQLTPSKPIRESLVFFLLPNKARATAEVVTPSRPAAQPHPVISGARTSKTAPAPDNAITVSPEEQTPPKIDWEQEAELATENAISNADRQNAYRNLSALSPAQLSWVQKNHLEPAEPGIPWKYRRVEITEGGLPIIHINDHCVAVPILMMMVFCKIGHIEPKGDLFEHMRDPRSP